MNNNNHLDHLILIASENPLPNAVAAEMLIKPGGTIWLLATKATHFTANLLADLLRSRFKAQGMSPMPVVDTPAGTSDYLDEADATDIFRATSVILNKIAASYKNRQIGQVGLNYTSDTKAILVHVYRAVDAWQRKQIEDRRLSAPVQFSYTDARRLSIRIDSQGEIPEYQTLKFTLQDLLDLHQLELSYAPKSETFLVATAHAWAVAAGKYNGLSGWERWCEEVLLPTCQKNSKWVTEWKLKEISFDVPTGQFFKPLIEELQLVSGKLHLGDASSKLGVSATDLCEWLAGGWLRHSVFDKVNNSFSQTFMCVRAHEKTERLGLITHLNEMSYRPHQNFEPSDVSGASIPPIVEFEIFAMRGPKPFVFTCIPTSRRDIIRTAAIEAVLQTERLTGGAANFIVVCAAQDVAQIENDLGRFLPGRKVSVFGARELVNFAAFTSKLKVI